MGVIRSGTAADLNASARTNQLEQSVAGDHTAAEQTAAASGTGLSVNAAMTAEQPEQDTAAASGNTGNKQKPVSTSENTENGQKPVSQAGDTGNTAPPSAAASAVPLGKTYAEMYPDYQADDCLPSETTVPEEELIRTEEDYLDARYPGRNRSQDRAVVLPEKVDNSASEYFPVIGNQGGIGSCTCWAMVYYQFTYTYNRSRQIKTTPENTFSPRFTYNRINGGEDHGSDRYSVYSDIKKYGCALWNDFPYDYEDYLAYPTDADVYRRALNYRLKSFQEFSNIGSKDTLVTSPDDEDLTAIKTALANHEVLSLSTNFSSLRADHLKALSTDASVNSGIVGEEVVVSCDDTKGGHAMTIVGYDDTIWTDLNGNDKVDPGEMGALKIANSHSEHYANKGFAWVAYDALNYKSCVEGAYNATNRHEAFTGICRIEVEPETFVPHQFAEYTVNTDDRYNTAVILKGEWANTVVTRCLKPSGVLCMDEYLSYDAKKTATDASVVLDVGPEMEQLNAPDISEVTWTVTLESREDKGHAITLKAFKIYDTTAGKSYDLSSKLPVTVEKTSKDIVVHESTNNNAVIYYRGYKDPVIGYILGSGQLTEKKMWFNDTEQYGYVSKYVIPLGSNTTARVKFGNGSGKWDDNNGQYYTVKKGDNLFVTPGVGEKLVLNIKPSLTGVCDLGCKDNYEMIMSGGYTPYQYRVVYQDNATKEILNETEYKFLSYYTTLEDGSVRYYSQAYDMTKECTYLVTVYLKDSAGTVATKTNTVTIKDEPLRFTNFSIENPKSEYPCHKEMQFNMATENDYAHGGNPNVTFYMMKDGRFVYRSGERMKIYGAANKTNSHTFLWTPTEGGEYTAIVDRTDVNGEYAFSTLKFKVASANVSLNSVTTSPEGLVGMGERISVTAAATGGDGEYQYRYSTIRSGKETVVQDWSGNSSASVQLPFDVGNCELVVSVKDGAGSTAAAVKQYQIVQGRIKGIKADKTAIQAESPVILSADTKNVAAGLVADNYEYTATLNGNTTTLTTNADKTATWTPAAAGTYTVKLTIRNGSQVLAASSKSFTVAAKPQPQEYKIRVGVIYYIDEASSPSQCQIHYWNQSGVVGDVTCVKTTATANVGVGSSFWGGAAQKFYIYEATIPLTATGYKFHIGNRWFGDDGNPTTSNAVYVFEYSSVDRAMYRKE